MSPLTSVKTARTVPPAVHVLPSVSMTGQSPTGRRRSDECCSCDARAAGTGRGGRPELGAWGDSGGFACWSRRRLPQAFGRGGWRQVRRSGEVQSWEAWGSAWRPAPNPPGVGSAQPAGSRQPASAMGAEDNTSSQNGPDRPLSLPGECDLGSACDSLMCLRVDSGATVRPSSSAAEFGSRHPAGVAPPVWDRPKGGRRRQPALYTGCYTLLDWPTLLPLLLVGKVQGTTTFV